MDKSEVGKIFLNLIKTSTPAKNVRKRKFLILQNLREEIKEARELGYSFKEISEYLTKSGAPVAAHQVQGFCREVLKEKPLYKRAKKVSTGKEKASVQKKNELVPNKSQDGFSSRLPKPLPPGFRVARDDL